MRLNLLEWPNSLHKILLIHKFFSLTNSNCCSTAFEHIPLDTEATGSKTIGAGAFLSSLLFLSLSLSFSGASLSKTHMGEGQNKSNAQRIDKILK